MFGFIYEWTNMMNKKKYIGSHSGDLNDGYIGSGTLFKKAVKKYGIKNFSRKILEIIEVNDRTYMLEREKYYLDYFEAYTSRNYYNVAKDVMGGDTRAGWTDDRRNEFKQQITDIWESRTEEEKRTIFEKTHQKTKAWLASNEGEDFKNRQRERLLLNQDKMKEGRQKLSKEDRSKSARLGKERMGSERRKEAARKGVLSRTPESQEIAKNKAKKTRSEWSEEKKIEVFNNMSKGVMGKCSGANNGRARKICAEGKVFNTLKEAMAYLKICEATLYKRLKDEKNNEYYYIT